VTWRKYAAWEAKVCRQFDRVIMATEMDRRRMQEFCGLVDNIDVIPNAADTEHYDYSRWLPEAEVLVYTGSLGYSANRDAVMYYKEEIMPLVRESYPNVQLLVTGRYESVDVDGIGKCAGIRLTGYVDDIRDVLSRASACIVPLRQGGGMRLKIPEAMAAGVPVVSTSVGVEGLSCTHGEHLLIGDTPEEFAAGIVRVLGDRTLAERLRENARRLVEERYSWRSSAGRFARLVESMVPQ
jgi:glycosyltransferase involved in cell wall biosynthesis